MVKYGPDVWKQFIQRLEAYLSRMQKLVQEQNEKSETVNRERKYHQHNTAYELTALTEERSIRERLELRSRFTETEWYCFAFGMIRLLKDGGSGLQGLSLWGMICILYSKSCSSNFVLLLDAAGL
nr:pre-mrna-splicing factor spf27 like [Quercus suber]